MIKLDSVVIRDDKIMHNQVDGEVVMLSPDMQDYLGMNETGSAIWEIIKEKTMVSKVVAILQSKYDVEKEKCENEVLNFLNKLSDNKLIKIL